MRSSARKVAHLRLAPRPHDELEGLRRQRAMWRARAHVLEAAYYGGLSPGVAESQRELALRGAALDAAERTLADLRSEVGAAAERIAEARQRSDELVELRRQLEDRESALLAQRSVVETAAAQLEEVRVELSARADTLAARERELERTSKTVDELANECRQLR